MSKILRCSPSLESPTQTYLFKRLRLVSKMLGLIWPMTLWNKPELAQSHCPTNSSPIARGSNSFIKTARPKIRASTWHSLLEGTHGLTQEAWYGPPPCVRGPSQESYPKSHPVFTLSLGALSIPKPPFQWYPQSKKSLLILKMKCTMFESNYRSCTGTSSENICSSSEGA
jgi:hypothetical protein